MDQRIEGSLRKGVGQLQDAVGGLTGDAATQLRGKVNQVAGSAQDIFGETQARASSLFDDIIDFTQAKPAVALAVAIGAGAALAIAIFGARRVKDPK